MLENSTKASKRQNFFLIQTWVQRPILTRVLWECPHVLGYCVFFKFDRYICFSCICASNDALDDLLRLLNLVSLQRLGVWLIAILWWYHFLRKLVLWRFLACFSFKFMSPEVDWNPKQHLFALCKADVVIFQAQELAELLEFLETDHFLNRAWHERWRNQLFFFFLGQSVCHLTELFQVLR